MSPMTPYRLAVAARYHERQRITQLLAEAQLDTLPAIITASWLRCTAEGDACLTDAQARRQAETNVREILLADLLLYVPSDTWSPGRCIDVGIALGNSIPVLIVGPPENSIYFRGLPSCEWGALRETVGRMLRGKGYANG